jgi:biopolymer transport protein ExbD
MQGSRRPVARTLSEINITPLIDVMLVLLIIFMLVTPLASRGLDLDLPAPAHEVSATPPPAVVLSLESGPEGTVIATLGRQPVALDALGRTLRDLYDTRSNKTLFVRVAGGLRYGQAVEAMDVARGAGVERIGLMDGAPDER